MFQRLLNPLLSQSFFLFGSRGTGKSTFLKSFFKKKKLLWYDLLHPKIEERFSLNPESLKQEILLEEKKIEWVVIDEIQKVPKLLDVVHDCIENTSIKFALTGSSARKLKLGSANLLAGRAFMNQLFPLTFREMGSRFKLEEVLQWGSLPKLTQFENDEERMEFLDAYALTYLKEEIWSEHLVRKLEPFRRFLPISAQMNGEILNYNKVAQDVGVDLKTIQNYFQILEDTLVAYLLPSYHQSIRKQQRMAPKFFLFDLGVKRALEGSLTVPVFPKTYGFGKAFEHFIFLECFRLNHYQRKKFKFYYLKTKDQAEIDLIIERPGKKTALVEIKSSEKILEHDLKSLERFLPDFKNAEAYCLSLDQQNRKMGSCQVLHWKRGIEELGL